MARPFCNKHQCRPLHDLANIDDIVPASPPPDAGGEPGGGKVSFTLSQKCKRRTVGTSLKERQINSVVFVKSLFVGYVISRKLRLRAPLREEGDFFQGFSAASATERHSMQRIDNSPVLSICL